MSENNQLIAQRTGQVALTEDLFTQDQLQVMHGVLSICDRNPKIKWTDKDPDHNLDFCLIEGKIEPVKGFCLKCIKVAGFSVEADPSPQIQNITRRDGSPDTMISVAVTITKGTEKYRMLGSSSLYEVDTKGYNKRATHDAIARAQTRALKLAVETAVGMPFINMVLAKLFGGYEVTGAPEDEGLCNVTPEQKAENKIDDWTPEGRATWKRIWSMLSRALAEKIITAGERQDVADEVLLNHHKPNVLLDIEADWKRKLADRRKLHAGN